MDKHDRDSIVRRTFLGLSATGLAAIAGCSSTGGDSGPDETTDETTESGSEQNSGNSPGGQSSYANDNGSLPDWIANPSYDGSDSQNSGPGDSGSTLWAQPSSTADSFSGVATVHAGVSYVAGTTGVRAFSPDGSELWNIEVDLPDGRQSIPFKFGETLVVATPSRVIGYNAENGERQYLNTPPSEFETSRPVAAHDGNVIYLGSGDNDQSLYALWYDPEAGEISRQSDNLVGSLRGSNKPVLGGGHLYVEAAGQDGSAGTLRAISLSDGSEVWSTGIPRRTIPRLFSNGVVLLARSGSGGIAYPEIIALDAETGDELWSGAGPGGDPAYAVSADSSHVYTHNREKVAAYGLEDGSQSWERTTASEIKSTFAIGSPNIYFGTTDDKIQVLDAVSGERRARYSVDRAPVSLTVVGNRLYCNSATAISTGDPTGVRLLVVGPGEV